MSDYSYSEEPSKAEQEGLHEYGGLGRRDYERLEAERQRIERDEKREREAREVSAADYSPGSHEQAQPLELEASTSEAAQVPEASEAVERPTIPEPDIGQSESL